MSAAVHQLLVYGFLFTWTTLLLSSGLTYGKPSKYPREEIPIRITPLNREACLARLICGMTVDNKMEVKREGQLSYAQYAIILNQFVRENPGEKILSEESEELLDDYSVSAEDIQSPSHQISHGMDISSLSPQQFPQSPGQLGEETSKESNTTSAEIEIKMRNAKLIRDVESKLKAVRECKSIAGCPYTFKSLVQRYGGRMKSSPQQQRPHRPQSQPLQVYAPANKHTWFVPENEQFSGDLTDDESFEDESQSPPPVLGGFLEKSPPSGYSNQNQAISGRPYTFSSRPRQPIQQQPIQQQVSYEQWVRPVIRRKPSPTPSPPKFQGTQKQQQRRRKKKPVKINYKTPDSFQQVLNNQGVKNFGDEDEDDDVNKTTPVELVGNEEEQKTEEANKGSANREEADDDDSEQDDYDEEEKYQVSTEYGDDEEDDDDDDEEKDKSKEDGKETKKSSEEKDQSANKEIQTTPKPAFPTADPKSKSKSKVKVEDDEEDDKNNIKKTKKKKEEDSSAEEDDDDVGPVNKYRDTTSTFPVEIGGRPLFPSYSDVPVAMTFGSSRPQAMNSGFPPSNRRPSIPHLVPMSSPIQSQPMTSSHSHNQQNSQSTSPQVTTSLTSWGMSRIAPFKNLLANGFSSQGSPQSSFNMFSNNKPQQPPGGVGSGPSHFAALPPRPQSPQPSGASMAGVKFPSVSPGSSEYRRTPGSVKKSKVKPASKTKGKKNKKSSSSRRKPSTSGQGGSDSKKKKEKKYKVTKTTNAYVVG